MESNSDSFAVHPEARRRYTKLPQPFVSNDDYDYDNSNNTVLIIIIIIIIIIMIIMTTKVRSEH
jgi:hypothetical protein